MHLLGFLEEFGADAHKREYVERVLSDTMRNAGFNRITVPVLEPYSSYSEEIVGLSPWPEWNSKCVFRFLIDEYDSSYAETDIKRKEVCLIPEGTVSITRWLASCINRGESSYKKLFYSLNCYRNELTATLSSNKKREFQQFGVEIMDSDNEDSDFEIINSIVILLSSLGIAENLIRIRLNNIKIFNKIVELCNIQPQDSILLKSYLDSIAECFAGKHPEEYASLRQKVMHLLSGYTIEEGYLNLWHLITNHSYCGVDDVINVFPASCKDEFNGLKRIISYFLSKDILIELDLSVIRSHQYYTGLSFEVDVVTKNNKFIEVAGGGRYDRLVGSFLQANSSEIKKIVPCTGFAFGTDRVIHMLNELNLLTGTKEIVSKFKF